MSTTDNNTNDDRNYTPAGKDSVAGASCSSGTSVGSGGEVNNNNIEQDLPTIFASQAYQDALEEVHARFILNLPESELETADRMFFQLEQAWWFYEDWICDPNPDVPLPRFRTLKAFAQQMFKYSPLLPDLDQFSAAWIEFTNYKRKISNYGCILLNKDCSKVVLCQVWNGKSWTLPSGKINQGEDGKTAAARETYEETGFDPTCLSGLTATWKVEHPEKITWKPALREQDSLSFSEDDGKQRIAYICTDVPEDYAFAPVCRKEVSVVAWHPIENLPKPSYAVIPFLFQLRKWIKKNRKGGKKTPKKTRESSKPRQERPNTPTNRRNKNKGQTPGRSCSGSRGRAGSRGRDRVVKESDDLVESGLATAGEISGWSEEDMFSTNEKLIGRKVEYDGNPHVFAEQGFAGKDPHAFHVVGGTFLNSGGGTIAKLAPPPDQSKLQPLFRSDNRNNGGNSTKDNLSLELTPFFSEEGATPWGEVVAEAQQVTAMTTSASVPTINGPERETPGYMDQYDPGQALLNMLQSGGLNQDQGAKAATLDDPSSAIFMTDAEITAKSQATKTQQQQQPKLILSDKKTGHWRSESRRRQYEQDMEYIQQWVANLPRPPPSKHFGEFKLDADAIFQKVASSQKIK